MTKPTLVNLKGLPYGGAQYVPSADRERFVRLAVRSSADSLWQPSVQDEYLSTYRAWIADTKLNTITGLDKFPISCVTQGTTEAFDKFYLKNSSRRLRYFKGEYMYHQVAGRQYFNHLALFIEDEELDTDDVVVISLPFSDTGNEHPRMKELLAKCTELKIPVLLDCAYIGICSGINFNLDYDCITDVTFSLSKTFPVPHLRIGMRLTRTDDDDALLVTNKTQYVNRLSLAVGTELMKHWSIDYIPSTYKDAQLDFCAKLGVEPSKCVIFGIDSTDKWAQYNRGGPTNRLCFAKYLHTKELPIDTAA
ncbi:Aminotransferase, class I/classII [uncultured Caudovirales phage]|uniref:Aminotransferase, class I/classII n=1 Tax=uncultured Caudovirales phage TaxID=2100421 RepID=A0A6J5L5Y7_9CAUD|nr:Aminotransferase, class I/classII [uncultured Caudovirales phage]